MEDFLRSTDNCVARNPECPEGWGLLGRQLPSKEQVAFSGLDYCLCGRSASLKGHVPRPYRAQSHSPGDPSNRTVMCPLAECREPGTKETCFLTKNDICSFCFPDNDLQRGQLALPVFALSRAGYRATASLSGALWRWMSGGWQETLEAGRVLREVLSSLLSKAASSLTFFTHKSRADFSHPPPFVQFPKLPSFPAISF